MAEDVFIEIVTKKFCTELTKDRIRRYYPPYIAEWKCNGIDMAERAEHSEKVAAIMRSVGLC